MLNINNLASILLDDESLLERTGGVVSILNKTKQNRLDICWNRDESGCSIVKIGNSHIAIYYTKNFINTSSFKKEELKSFNKLVVRDYFSAVSIVKSLILTEICNEEV